MILDRPALQELGRQIGTLSVAPASARLWWPGLELDDDSAVHPHYPGPFEDPDAIVESIRRLVLTVSRDRWREPARVTAFDRDLRHHREELGRAAATRVTAEIERLRAAAAADHLATSESSNAAAQQPIQAYEQQLEGVAADLFAVQEELERQRIAAEDAENHWVEAEEQRVRLEQENRSLLGQLEGFKAHLRARAVADGAEPLTEEQLFETDVRASWEARLTPDDRSTHPMAPLVIGREFIASISRASADRQKVVDTVMEVACGRAKEIDGRQLHKLRTGTGGNTPERRRANDGAVAWRCNIQTNSPSARRLHFWACPGGTFEFISVVTHDDFSIAE